MSFSDSMRAIDRWAEGETAARDANMLRRMRANRANMWEGLEDLLAQIVRCDTDAAREEFFESCGFDADERERMARIAQRFGRIVGAL